MACLYLYLQQPDLQKTTRQKEVNQDVLRKEIEENDFLHQIRTKVRRLVSFDLRLSSFHLNLDINLLNFSFNKGRSMLLLGIQWNICFCDSLCGFQESADVIKFPCMIILASR